jgi:hypothetical protein
MKQVIMGMVVLDEYGCKYPVVCSASSATCTEGTTPPLTLHASKLSDTCTRVPCVWLQGWCTLTFSTAQT